MNTYVFKWSRNSSLFIEPGSLLVSIYNQDIHSPLFFKLISISSPHLHQGRPYTARVADIIILFTDKYQQDTQCTYSLTLWRVRVTLLPRKRNNCYLFSLCVCVCVYSCPSYPACNAHTPHYIVICDLSDSHNIFLTLSHKRHDFREKRLLNIKLVLFFSTTCAWHLLHSKKNSAR
jgi:hypothetical protein